MGIEASNMCGNHRNVQDLNDDKNDELQINVTDIED